MFEQRDDEAARRGETYDSVPGNPRADRREQGRSQCPTGEMSICWRPRSHVVQINVSPPRSGERPLGEGLGRSALLPSITHPIALPASKTAHGAPPGPQAKKESKGSAPAASSAPDVLRTASLDSNDTSPQRRPKAQLKTQNSKLKTQN